MSRRSLDLAAKIWRSAMPAHCNKLVLQCMVHHVNDESGLCWPSVERVALMCGMNTRTAQRHLRALQAAGLLRPKLRTGRTTHYSVHLDGLVGLVFPSATVVLDAEPVDNSTAPPEQPAKNDEELSKNDTQPDKNDAQCVEIATLTVDRTVELTEDRTAAPASPVALPSIEEVKPETLADFAACRKAKFGRSTKGRFTAALIDSIRAEATLAGLTLQAALEHCCHPERRWASFKAEWLKPKTASQPAPAAPVKVWAPDTTPIPPAQAATPAGPPPEPVKLATPEVVAAALTAYRAKCPPAPAAKPAPAGAPAMPSGASDISIAADAPPWAVAIVTKHRSGQPVSRNSLHTACQTLKIDPTILRRASATTAAASGMH
jgi:hypothetical protein